MSFTLCTSGALARKAGVGVNATASTSGGFLAELSDDAEGYINAVTRFDWVANYSSISANFKPILAMVSSSIGAIHLASYDASGYLSLAAYEDLMNVLNDKVVKGLKFLQDKKVQEKMGVTG